MDMPLKLSKQDLLSELERRRPDAEKADAKALKKHEAEEKRFITLFRKACAEAAKWDYATAKENNFDIPDLIGSHRSNRVYKYEAPSCPISQVARIDEAMALVGATNQETFTLTSDGPLFGLYRLLREDMPKAGGLC